MALSSDEDDVIELPVPHWQRLDADDDWRQRATDEEASRQANNGHGQWAQQAMQATSAGKAEHGKPFRIEYDEDDEGQ